MVINSKGNCGGKYTYKLRVTMVTLSQRPINRTTKGISSSKILKETPKD